MPKKGKEMGMPRFAVQNAFAMPDRKERK